MKIKNILVTDGENRASLATTRSLGRRGHNVIVSGLNERNISSVSKYCAGRCKTKDPCLDASGYLDDIIRIVLDYKIDIIFPMTEPSIYILQENRKLLPHDIIIASPDLDITNTVFDKTKVFKIAQKHNVAIPETLFIENRADYKAKRHLCKQYPLVIKPGMSRIPFRNGFKRTKVLYVQNENELTWHYEHDELLDYPSMIQEMIQGQGTGLFTLFNQNKHLALFCHNRIKEKPPSGGVSVVSESVPLDNEMVAASHVLLSAVGWQGVAMVEFKRDMRDGKPKLMEINGRLWGSLQLAIDCGVDFPCMLLDYLLCEFPVHESPKTYRSGHKLIWPLGVLDHLILRLKHSNQELNLPAFSPSRYQSLMDMFRLFDSNASFDVINREDMMPFIIELKEYVRNILGGS